ncbi:MAG: methyltransferase [Gammaproteobacteria bacterium]|nr:MAG: methyltransferase [Gammaproteobacteria bacterium]
MSLLLIRTAEIIISQMEKIKPGFTQDPIAETLLLTVALRAFDARQKQPVLGDEKSVELMQQIDYDFERFTKGSMMSRLGSNVRLKYFDNCAKKFIADHDQPIVGLLGCGLDTRYQRLGDARKAVFYELDLAEVIAFRKKLLPETENNHYLGYSIFDPTWMEKIKTAHPDGNFLFIIEGVLMYFEGAEVRSFLCALADTFPGSEICFDLLNVWSSKNTKHHDTLRNMQASFKWGLDDDQELVKWHPGLELISSESIMWQMGDYHWFPRLLRYVKKFRNASRMLHLRVGAA